MIFSTIRADPRQVDLLCDKVAPPARPFPLKAHSNAVPDRGPPSMRMRAPLM